ncbi:DUF3570 domain-containing protein [Methyloglobulus sp.]|uniref:DUF3570 domain-containing protein n=1 Tax=Methyloglobulus sp. TaxID=2518622 RepID=UPI0032B8091F
MAVIKRKAKKPYKRKGSLVKSFDGQRKCPRYKLSTNSNLLGSAALSPFVVSLSNHLFPSGYERAQQPKRGVEKPDCVSLQALTAAALILPSLFQPAAQAADDDEVDFQYSHYQEGKRDIYGGLSDEITQAVSVVKYPTNLNPIEVDSLHGSARISLTDRVKFAFNYTQDTWSGATPLSTAPALALGNRPHFNGTTITGASPYAQELLQSYFDQQLNPLQIKGIDPNTGNYVYSPATSSRLVHTLAAASPETRKQGDFKLSYEWDEAALEVGGGISIENDFESRFASLGGRMDFNGKQTTANANISYTDSDITVTLDPESFPFIDRENYNDKIDLSYDSKSKPIGGQLLDKRQDWSAQLGLTQILNQGALLNLGVNYTRSTGFLANPYKLVTVVYLNPLLSQLTTAEPLQEPIVGIANSRMEVRPDERNQFNWNAGYVQYIEPLDAALHFDYHFTHDDWDINAHTFEADWVQPLGAGWTVTPRVRYYSQSNADFYTPYVQTVEVLDDETGLPVASKLNRSIPTNYSSDHRLSGFGTLSGGVTVNKQFTKGIQLEAGIEYYSHAGNLKLGGGGEQDFADYDYFSANAALKVNLSAVGSGGGSSHNGYSGHEHHHSSNAPAGVMYDHSLDKSGDIMFGYRFMRNEQAGDMLNGSQVVDADTVRFNGCADQECKVSPDYMAMNMHMLDLMYAPTDWLTLMLMPQWVDMEMTMTPLFEIILGGHAHGTAVHSHQTGGIGDTGLYALFKLFDKSDHHLTLSIGGTAPTGDDEVTLRITDTNPAPNTPIHYGMQLGSGTWDFKPSLTYTGKQDAFSWGAQVTGTRRLEGRNESNFAFGDIFQSSVWGGYHWTNWLSTTVRGIYTWQDKIHGEYLPLTLRQGTPYKPTHIGPFDQPANYGGQFVELGLGINVSIPSGAFAGNTLKFEWLQPVHTDVNGYQLDRDGALSFTWSYGF